jgi:hypothetical protein
VIDRLCAFIHRKIDCTANARTLHECNVDAHLAPYFLILSSVERTPRPRWDSTNT